MNILLLFLAVQDSSIGDLVVVGYLAPDNLGPDNLAPGQFGTRQFGTKLVKKDNLAPRSQTDNLASRFIFYPYKETDNLGPT